MIGNKIKQCLIVVLIGGICFSKAIPVIGQEVKDQKPPIEAGSVNGPKEWDPKLGEWLLKRQKRPVVAGVPMGSQRSEIMRIFSEKNISPQQRTVPMDIFPRLIGEISYLNEAHLFYTKDRLSKLKMIFNVPIDAKTSSGGPLFNFYGELRKNLVRGYGQPTNTTSYVHPNFSYELVALETENAYFFDYWENVDDMKVLLSLKGRDGEIAFTLTYQYLPLFEEK